MLYKNCLFFLFLFFGISLQSQEISRINTIENQLELLKVDYPEFEEAVSVNISHTTLSNLLLAISKVHGINLNVSPELETINVINNFSNVSIADLLVFLAQEYNLEIQFTGNIISVSRYQPPAIIPMENEILAQYEPASNALSLDLQADPLGKVFRKITDVSGKNLVFAPGMESLPLSVYLQEVSFDAAMEKMAMSNNLEVTQSRDGFFIFNSLNAEGETVPRAVSRADNFFYKVLDLDKKVLEVDFKNVPVADIINTFREELNLNIFTATPLTEMGNVTVTADKINFDTLLDKIFESKVSEAKVNFQNNPQLSQAAEIPIYNYKKEDGLYFFGTENQLALKSIEIIPMMHRSIEMLSDPEKRDRNQRPGRNNFMTGGTSFYPGNANNLDQNYPVNNTRNQTQASNETVQKEIQQLFPNDLLAGIEVKVDTELNSFVVSGSAARIERFRDFVQYIDKPVPVILIEVMILEVNKNATVETGVSFGLGEEPVETEGQAFPNANMRLGAKTVNRIIGGFDGFGSLNMGKVLPNFYMDIKAMETNGNLRILSTPKLSTLNGHRAHLSSGETTYYAVTSQSFFGSQIPQTSEVTNYYPIDAELALDIKPFVSGDGEITLDINVVQSSFNGERIAEDAPPGMNSREFSSIIRMRDQDVAILGGIEERTKDDSGSGVPLLARIPVLKWLFSERRREDSRKTLSILIKPTVIY